MHPNIYRFAPHILSLLLLTFTQQGVANDKRAKQREQFLQAETALKKGEMDSYLKLKSALTSYPLLPYLEQRELASRIADAKETEIQGYLKKYDNTLSAFFMRASWLNHLAKKERWQDFVKHYQSGGGTAMQCRYFEALIHSGHKKKAYKLAASVWLNGSSLPDLCDPVFKQMHKDGKLTPKLVWQRMDLIRSKKGKKRVPLMRYMKRLLPKSENGYHELWMQTLRQPEKVLASPLLKKKHISRGNLLTHTISRLAWRNRDAALKAWKKYSKGDTLDAAQKKRVQLTLGKALSRRKHPKATAFLDSIQSCWQIYGLCEQRIHHALKNRQWNNVVSWIEDMPKKTQQHERWSYWKARALEELGKKETAIQLFKQVAKDRSYYGFMAADKVNAPYRLNHKGVPVTKKEVTNLAKLPGLQRAHELFKLDRRRSASSEWRRATRNLDKKGLMVAAKLAKNWGWSDRAIYTLLKTRYWDDLEIRFPLDYRKRVEAEAKKYGIDTAWIYAIIRQESTFVPDARSPVGAMGLMQLMPKTAQGVGRRLKMKGLNTSRILQTDNNIRLGSRYLKELHDQFNGWLMLATPSYNAGPHRTDRWLPNKSVPADLWIELIPFNETRLYVKRVMSYLVLYEYRLGQEVTRLRDRIPPNIDKSLLKVKPKKPASKKSKAVAFNPLDH